MDTNWLVGLGLIVGLTVLWAAVQGAWRRSFAGLHDDPDALAGRDCGGCACTNPCERKARANEEEGR